MVVSVYRKAVQPNSCGRGGRVKECVGKAGVKLLAAGSLQTRKFSQRPRVRQWDDTSLDCVLLPCMKLTVSVCVCSHTNVRTHHTRTHIHTHTRTHTHTHTLASVRTHIHACTDCFITYLRETSTDNPQILTVTADLRWPRHLKDTVLLGPAATPPRWPSAKASA